MHTLNPVHVSLICASLDIHGNNMARERGKKQEGEDGGGRSLLVHIYLIILFCFPLLVRLMFPL